MHLFLIRKAPAPACRQTGSTAELLWVRMESDHPPLSYQESVLPMNY